MIICFNDEVILNKDYLLIPIRKIGKNFVKKKKFVTAVTDFF